MKRRPGRPSLYNSREKLEKLIEEYFKEDKEPTLAGLAYYLGMSRDTLNQYSKKQKYSDVIKKAKDYVMSVYERRLLYSNKPVGVIFALKNMGWKDRQDITTNDRPLPTPIYGGKAVKAEK